MITTTPSHLPRDDSRGATISPYVSFGDPREHFAAHLVSTGSIYSRALGGAPGLRARRIDLPIADDTWFALAAPVVAGERIWQGTRRGLRCVTSAGNPVWSQADGASTDAVALHGQRVFSGARDAVVRAWSLDGDPLWSVRVADWVSGLTPTPEGGVVVGTRGGEVLCLSASGSVQWRTVLPSRVFAAPCLGPNSVFVGARDGRFYALDLATGAVLRVRETGSDIHGGARVVGGAAYFGSDDKRIYALDANTFAVRWMFRTGDAVWSRPVFASGLVCCASTDGYCYGIDPESGRSIWEYGCGGPVRLGLATDGRSLFVGTETGDLVTLSASTGELLNVNHVGAVWASPTPYHGEVYVSSRDSGVWVLGAPDVR